MINFDKLLKDAFITNIKTLAGGVLEIQEEKKLTIDEMDTLTNPICAYFTINEEQKVAIYMPSFTATTISSLMLEVQANPRNRIEEHDREALKNFFTSMATSIVNDLTSNNINLSLKFDLLKDIKSPDDITIKNVEVLEIKALFKSISKDVLSMYFIYPQDALDLNNVSTVVKEPSKLNKLLEKKNFSRNELKNLDLILDVKIEVKVRIGSKSMFLKDAINMDIGSVVELDKLLNEPLDILVDNKIIGHGEAVVVDGNFGIRVTDIIDIVTRLESIRQQ
jgi:flagellar motor switch protein FliN/FliY